MGFLNGTSKWPSDAVAATKWDADNSTVIAWLIGSMQLEIGKTYLFFETAHEMCEAIKKAYSKRGNDGLMFELHKLIWNAKQGDLDVTFYFNKLRNLWLELDHYQSNVENSRKTSLA